MNITTLSQRLSTELSKISISNVLSDTKLNRLFSGQLDITDITSYDEYDRLYKYRHDAIHLIICNNRSLPFGEKKVSMIIDELKDPQYDLIKNQTPDIMQVEGKTIKIVEITISTMKDPEVKKISKYSLLVKVLERNGYKVDLEIIVVSSTQGLPDRGVLNEIHGLSHHEIDLITDILTGFHKSLQRIHITELGALWHLKFRDVSADDFHFHMDKNDIIRYYSRLERKPFNSEDDLKMVLNSDEPMSITRSDDRFINLLVNRTLTDPSPYEKTDPPKVDKIYKFHQEKSNRLSLKCIINLPYIRATSVDSAERHVYDKEKKINLDEDKVEAFKGELINSSDSYLRKVSGMSGCFSPIKLDRSEQVQDALDGPGRKHFLSKVDCEKAILEKEKEDTRLWFPLFDNDQDIEEMAANLSKIDNIDEIKTLDDLIRAKGPGLDYVRFFQNVMREVAINSGRRKRNHNFILKPTSVDHVFILIYPGPRLRTGENLSQIFFKILISKKINVDMISNSWIFKRLLVYDKCYMSKWISTDANRLDHYIRAFDKILMAYSCYMMYGPNDLITNIKSDTSNTLGMIILTYLEDKRCTSKMLQDVRYVVMASLSMFRYWDDILEKFTDPMRSCLQVYYLRRILKYISDSPTKINEMIKTCKFGKSVLDPVTHEITDKLAGSIITIPRILTKGSNVVFQQALCEMYFTMLFNKNQDDPTHASHQILTKILEGDDNLRKVKSSTKLHTGFQRSDIEDAKILLDNPQKNQFSRRAIIIASKLQSTSEYNSSPGGVAYTLASQNKFLNKTFDEFSTYKSSALSRNEFYNGSLNVDFDERGFSEEEDKRLLDVKKRLNRETIKGEYELQNPRVRCISSTIALMTGFDLNNNREDNKIKEKVTSKMNELIESRMKHSNLVALHSKGDTKESQIDPEEYKQMYKSAQSEIFPWRSFDLLDKITEPNIFQVFKKNQIGGVREIIILSIQKRILINILETFSRLICKEDSREMLTHGNLKFQLFREMVRELKRNPEKRLIMNYNFDKTKWGPSFMPIQFLYMFLPFKKKIPGLFNFIVTSLMNHTNKECIIPEKLIRSWASDPYNMKHHNPLLQKLKEQFQFDNRLRFINESNMGQGILHYTSSLFHLCVISLRHHIYIKACERENIVPGEFRELVSSDDSYTAQALPMDNRNKNHLRIKLFLRAQWVVERLMNVWTSKSKSSISLLIYEFNSLFGSNLGVFPTTFKFALSSVQPVNTDSFYRMVKESYNESRQLVENGGSLELYLLSQKMNKIYSEQIYHTHSGGQNDFRRENIREHNMPYHLGVFPVGNPAIMIMMGPEFHNYDIFTRLWRKGNDGVRIFKQGEFSMEEIKIWEASHHMIDLNPDVLASMHSFDNLYIGMTRIEAQIGPINKLLQIRRSLDLTWTEVLNYFIKNPISLFRTPESLEECKVKTYLKLFQNSASEALRTTAASIYYARVSATVSKDCFYIPFLDRKLIVSMTEENGRKIYYDADNNEVSIEEANKSDTYMNCLRKMINMNAPSLDPNSFYMYVDEYDVIKSISSSPTQYHSRHRLETQNLRSLTLNKIMQKILNPIPNLLHKFWFQKDTIMDMENSEKRDWVNLKDLTGIISDTYDETLDNIVGQSKEDKIRKLVMIILRLMSYGTSPMKAIIYGPSSKSFETTFHILNNYNYHFRKTNEKMIRSEIATQETAYYSDIYHAYNYFMLSKFADREPNIHNYLDHDKIELLFRDPGVSPSIKKRILMMLIYSNILDDIKQWTLITSTILHNWDKRQEYDEKTNKYSGPFELRLQQGDIIALLVGDDKLIKIYTNHFKDPKVLHELLSKAAELLNIDMNELIKKVKKGPYKVTPLGIKNITTRDGFLVDKIKLTGIIYNPGDIEFNSNQIILVDKKEKQIMATTLGLIQIDGRPGFNYIDFKTKSGVYFSKLIRLGVFSPSFSIETLPPSLCIEALDDIKVEKPRITKFTKDRFDLNDWDERDDDSIMSVLSEAIGLESKEDSSQYINELLINDDDDLNELYDIGKRLATTDDAGDLHQELLSVDFDIDIQLVSSHTNITISKPVALWNTLEHIKELLITRSICDIRKMSSSLIKKISKIMDDINIFYSLVYVYDRIFRDSVTKSPEFFSLNIPMEFIKKFNLF